MNIMSSLFCVVMCLVDGGHNHCLEIFGFKDYDLVIVISALLVVCSLTKEISLFVGGAGFVVEGEMVFCPFSNPMSLSSV